MRISPAATLIEAVKNNVSDIQDLIKQTKDINTVDSDGYSALRYAIKNRNWAIVDILLENNVRVEFDELYEILLISSSANPMLMFIFNGQHMPYASIIKKLLERTGSETINAVMINPEVKFILLECCLKHPDIFDLICKNAKLNSKDFTDFFKIKEIDNPNHIIQLEFRFAGHDERVAIPLGNGIFGYRIGRLFPFNIITKLANAALYAYHKTAIFTLNTTHFIFSLIFCRPSLNFFSSRYDELFKTGFEKALASLGAYEIVSMMENMDSEFLFRSMSHINFNRIIHQNEVLDPADREVIKAVYSKAYLFFNQPGISIERDKDGFIRTARGIPKYPLTPKDAKKWFDLLDSAFSRIKKEDYATKDQILKIMLELSCKCDINPKNIYQAWQTYAKMSVYYRQEFTKMIYAYMKKEIPENPSRITKPDPWLKLFDAIDNLLTDYDYTAKDQILFLRAKVLLRSDPLKSFEYSLQIKNPLNLDAADNLLISDILYADSRSSLNMGIRNRAAAYLSQAARSGDGMAKDRLKDRSQPVMPNTSGFDLEIIYPKESKDNQEFNQKLDAWKREHKPNDVLFIYSPPQKAWEGYLIQKDNAEPKIVLIAKSPFVEFAQELKHIDSESSVVTYDKHKLRALLIKYPLFSDAKLYRSPLSMNGPVSSVEEKKKAQAHGTVEKAKKVKCDEKIIERFEDHKDDRDRRRCFVGSDPRKEDVCAEPDFSYQRLISLDEDEMPSIELSTGKPMPESKLHQSQHNTHHFFRDEKKDVRTESKDTVITDDFPKWLSLRPYVSVLDYEPVDFYSDVENGVILEIKYPDECKSQPTDVKKSKKHESIEEARFIEVQKILETNLQKIRKYLIERFQATTDIDSWTKVARSSLKFFKLAYTDADYRCRKNYYVRLEQIYQQSKLPVAEDDCPADTLVDEIISVLNEALQDQRIIGGLTHNFSNLLIGMLKELNHLSKQLSLRPEFYHAEPHQVQIRSGL